MSYAPHDRRFDRDRLISGLGVAAVHAVLGYALLTGLGASFPEQAQDVLDAFDVTEPPPPPSAPPPDPPRPMTERAPREEGAAAPPNITSRATEATAPETQVPIPPPLTVAPLPGTGNDPSSGNAPIVGPGTGAGGFGDGTGSGRWGNGPGGGGGGGTPLRLLSGRITDRDYPMSALRAEASGTVGLRFQVGIDGRVASCTVTSTSGDASLDFTTCDLIKKRFRYRPPTDRFGRPYAETVTGSHEWYLRQRIVDRDEYVEGDDEPAEDEERPRRRRF